MSGKVHFRDLALGVSLLLAIVAVPVGLIIAVVGGAERREHAGSEPEMLAVGVVVFVVGIAAAVIFRQGIRTSAGAGSSTATRPITPFPRPNRQDRPTSNQKIGRT